MSQTRDQQRFTISEVAADWHEPLVPHAAQCFGILRYLMLLFYCVMLFVALHHVSVE